MCSSHSSHYVFIFKTHPSISNQTSNSKNIFLLSLALSGIPILIRISLYVCLMPTNYERNCSTNLTLMLCQIDGNLYCCGKYPSLMGYNEYNPLRFLFFFMIIWTGRLILAWTTNEQFWQNTWCESSCFTADVLGIVALLVRDRNASGTLRGKWITSVML